MAKRGLNAFVILLLLLVVVLPLGLMLSMDKNTLKSANATQIVPIPAYIYYAVSPKETEVTFNVSFFCPTTITKPEIEAATISLGNTNSIEVTKKSIFSTLENVKGIEDHYYVDLLLTVNVETMASDILAFKTFTLNITDQEQREINIGTLTIDKHFSKMEETTSSNKILADIKPRVFYGYPDNAENVGDSARLSPTALCYQIRPVSVYSTKDTSFAVFEEKESGFYQEQSPLELYETCRDILNSVNKDYD